MKILLLGKNGQVGWELQRSLSVLGELVALDRHSQDYCGDLSKLDELTDSIDKLKPDVIVNAGACTAVDKAESEPELAHRINAEAPKMLAHEAKKNNAWLIHYSTDYVFDGSGEAAWQEEDVVNPLNEYGKTKLAGETAIKASGCQYLIFRTSWVYAARGHNFAKTMLRLAKERDSLSVIRDQIGAPTSADLIADVTAHAIRIAQGRPEVSGLYHLVAEGQTSWYDYAKFVLSYARDQGVTLTTPSERVFAIASSEYPTPAARPLNSRLNHNKLESTFSLKMPNWQEGVKRMLAELLVN